jgi:hypothetical protein
MGVIDKYTYGQYTLTHSSLTVTESGGIVAQYGLAGMYAYGITNALAIRAHLGALAAVAVGKSQVPVHLVSF